MRRRLVVLGLAISALIVIALMVPLALLVRTVAADRAVSAGRADAAALVPVVATVRDADVLARILEDTRASSPRAISLLRADGSLLGAPMLIDEGIALARTGRAFAAEAAGGVEVLVPVVLADGSIDVIRVFVPEAELRSGVLGSWLVLAAVGVALVLIGALVADALARTTVRPLRDVAAVARRLDGGDLEARARPEGPPEIVDVARALNALGARIRERLRAERETAADLSHRLRTPLAALALEADTVADDVARGRLLRVIDELTRAVDRLIRDVRGAAPAAAAVSDLARETAERVAFWSALADEQRRQHALDVADAPLIVAVPADELRALIDTLLDNVLRHTPEGTPFRVAARDEGGRGVLVVEDEGPGLGATLPARGTSGAGSTGLGLDIARRIAEASGGGMRITRGASGRGMRVEVAFGAVPGSDATLPSA